jgi:hypothetical protein
MTRPSLRWALVAALACTLAPVLAPAGATASDGPPSRAQAAGEDSPWPRTNRLRPHVRAARREINRLKHQIERMQLSVARYDNWETCLRYVRVTEYGDPWFNRFGYIYDVRIGTGAGFMDAIATDRRRRKSDYQFIDFDRSRCRSAVPLPGGTAEPASVQPSPATSSPGPAVAQPLSSQLAQPAQPRTTFRRSPHASASRASRRGGLAVQTRRLARRTRGLIRRARVLHTASERFDAWESCVSWVPVTEQGGADLKYGYLFGREGQAPGYRPALHIDRSDWDDPDYMFLALVGRDRPGGTCQDEPGEAVD